MCTIDGIAIQGPFSCNFNDEQLMNYTVFEQTFDENSTTSNQAVGVVKRCHVTITSLINMYGIGMF